MGEAVDVFISYARADRNVAEKVARVIGGRGFGVWWDIQRVRTGQDFEALIRRALHRVKCVVALWTPSSVDPDAPWVRAEATIGNARDVLVPVTFVPPWRIPLPFNTLSTIDLTTWDGTEEAPEVAVLLQEIQWRVDVATETSDPLAPSTAELTQAVDRSLDANQQIGTLMADIRAAVPGLRGAAAQPLAQLDTVLDEVHATVRAVNTAVADFIAPALTPDTVDRNPAPYLDLASRDLFAVIEEGRGHCGDISTLYYGPGHGGWEPAAAAAPGSLRRWVHATLDPATAGRLDAAFGQLAEADLDLFARMGELGTHLSTTARDVVRLLAHARPDDARALVVESIDPLQRLQGELSDRMSEIVRLKAQIRQS